MPLYKNHYLDRAAIGSTNCTAKFTVTQEAHPKLGQGFELEVWTGCTVTVDAKSSTLNGNGAWPVTHTSTYAEGPTFEFADVPWEERLRFVEFIGDGNGAAGTIGKWDIVAQLPGLPVQTVSLEGAKNESIANIALTKEGSAETLGGPFRRPLISGIDPLRQDF
jgi:hypothetical protein